jgi:hypothetical protein
MVKTFSEGDYLRLGKTKRRFRQLVSMRQIRRTARCILAACLCLLPLQVLASEVQLRLAFVYNFIKFIEWPAKSSQITLCVLGDQPGLQDALLPLHEKVFAGRKLHVVHFSLVPEAPLSDQSSFSQCQVLYLILPSMLPEITETLPEGLVLVTNEVTDIDPRVSFSLVRAKDNRMEFYVNTQALSQAKVTASSQLLKLAKNYQGAAK